MSENNTEDSVTFDKKDDWSHDIVKVSFFGLCIFLVVAVLCTYTDLLCLIDKNCVQNKQIWASALPILVMCIVGIGILFFVLMKRIENQFMADSTNFILTQSEKQYEIIRKWALDHHGLYLQKCTRTGTSPPIEAGEASSFPHTKHYEFENIKNGIVWNYAHIKNPLFKKTNIFELVKTGFFIDTPTHYWYGEAKQHVPQRISDTSATTKGIQAGGTNEYDDDEEYGSATI